MKKREFCKALLDIIDEWEEDNFDGLIEEAVCNEDWFELVHMIYDRLKGTTIDPEPTH